MTKNSKYQVGDRIGDWCLVEQLGAGANAEVWRADRYNRTAALKILFQKKVEKEPYRRFRDEITIMRKLGVFPGILPLLDAKLPDSPSHAEPAWLALPLASSVRNALGSHPDLDMVITALARYARTLAELANNHAVFHRDLNPENLYYHENDWCIGDFGLVDFPGKEAITAPGKHIGPIHYLAPELLINPASAASGPADVYALAKTLWVLLTRQNYPIPGELRADTIQTRISSYVNSPKAAFLELLLERCTQIDPHSRPAMNEVAAELDACRARDPHSLTRPNLRDVASRFLPILRKCKSGAKQRHKIENEIDQMMERIAFNLAPIEAEIAKSTGLETSITCDNHVNTIVRHFPDTQRSLSANVVCRDPRSGDRANTSLFISGIGLHYGESGTVSVAAAHGIRVGTDQLLWSRICEAQVFSARLQEVLETQLAELAAALPDALQALATYLDESII